MLTSVKKYKRVTGADRNTLTADVKKVSEKGATIRSIAEPLERSYGFVHRLLSESDVTLRSRGGTQKKKRK